MFRKHGNDWLCDRKIFDCLYAGTIPLYWGAPDIDLLVPPDAYVDVRHYSSWEDMWTALSCMSEFEINAMREAGRQFLTSNVFLKYYDSLLNIFGNES